MTTAHRPTFDPARGKDQLRGPAYHQRLLPAHTHLKQRQRGQGGTGDNISRDLRAELLRAEAHHRTGQDIQEKPENTKTLGQSTIERPLPITPKYETLEGDLDSSEAEAKRRQLILEEAKAIDADSEDSESVDEDSDDESSEEDDDDDDDELTLQRELAKVKAERAERKAAEDADRAAKDAEQREAEIARGNPLLNKNNFGVKRRWDDDVVFKNQARGTEEKTRNKEFVNDLLRSDFHKRFMSKYVR